MRRACLLVLASLLFGCDPTPPAGDAGPPDAPVTCETRPLSSLSFAHGSLGVTPGTGRATEVGLAVDYCREVEVTLSASVPGLATFPAAVTIPVGRSHAEVEIVGVAAGSFVLTATAMGPNGPQTATLDVDVIEAGAVPDCSGSASGTASPGGRVEGSLAGAALSVAAGAARDDRYHVDPFAVTIDCAEDIVPEGYVALGPAIRFTSPDAYRFRREVQVSVPIALALLPTRRHRGHVEIAYVGPGVPADGLGGGRIVAIADPIFEGDAGGGTMRFSVPRLGTYQAVVVNEPARRVERRFVYRGVMGFSMGGSGSGRIGTGNPDLFDLVAPLGGPTDWSYMLEHIRSNHLGGFCTEAERLAGGDCDAASLDRVPETRELLEHPQHFENWWYEDGYEGQGGTFDRRDYMEIFRDLAAMFGNANHDRTADGTSEPDILPPGVPAAMRDMTSAERCENTAVLAQFFDDEYNPDGSHPVITFCDGAQRTGVPGDPDGGEDVGNWDPDGTQTIPIEVALAVDLDEDGVRDAGEPVIRNGRENWDDVGCDGTASALEAGYDPLTNPDPEGDDYDFQYNPAGTEGNYLWDPCREGGTAERFDDFGLDGVEGTCQLGEGPTCYDSGEGNGRFDRTRGGERMIASSPRAAVLGYESSSGERVPALLDDTTIARLDFYADGGVRDLFNWAVMGHHSMGAFAARGLPVRYYNGHGALHGDGREPNNFGWDTVDWDEIGRFAMVRYGSIDATESQLERGDGGHVGTTDQLASRVYSAVALMSARWPEGDTEVSGRETVSRVPETCSSAGDPSCFAGYNWIDLDFVSSTGRSGPAVIVLPPYYFDEGNEDRTYPVMYFLHGYGMDPGDLPGLGLLMWNDMINALVPGDRRLEKMIFVFPDGRCRGDECLRGTFYTDAPENSPEGAQMQQFMLDLIDFVDGNFRTRAPETVEVWE